LCRQLLSIYLGCVRFSNAACREGRFAGDTAATTRSLSDARETDPQFDANVKNENCTERREDEAGRVKAFVCRRHEQMSYGSAKDRADHTEHDGPDKEHMHVQH